MEDCLTELYYMRKAILMKESYDGNNSGYKKIWDDAGFAYEHASECSLVETVHDFASALNASIPPEIREEWEYSDYEAYTDRFYHRKYWNEIELDSITEALLLSFSRITGTAREQVNQDNGYFVLDLYDFNDWSLFFPARRNADEFCESYDCAPATLFYIQGNDITEIYSL